MQQFKTCRMLLRSTFLLRSNCPVRHGVIHPLNAKKKIIRKTSSKSTPLKESFDVYAISDLHTDSEANLEWVRGLSEDAYQNDVLIVAGDISHKHKLLKTTLKLLVSRFCRVAFVPGNHELWARDLITAKGVPPRVDSMGKLDQVMTLCKKLGIITQPTKLRNLWLIPLLSWHHQGFDREPDGPDFKPLSEKRVSDYKHCDWSSLDESVREHGVDELALHFDKLNPKCDASFEKCDVITFSHFVPLQELIPEKRYLKIPFLAKVAGSTYLYDRIKALNPDIHVFGHTHIAWDINIDGTRFVQCPLGQVRERQIRPRSMLSATSESDPRLKITPVEETQQDWDGEAADWLPVKIYSHKTNNSKDSKSGKHKRVRKLRSGKMCESFAFWSEHYKRTQRKPEILERDDGS